MGAMNNENNSQSLQLALGTVSGTATSLVGYLPKKAKLKSVKFYSAAGFAASDTNYLVSKLKVGSAEKAIHSSKLTGGNSAIAAGVTEFALSDKDLAQDSKLELEITETGTVSVDLHAVVEYYPL